ncbi:hypothetical protein CK203_111664 [Vitis vinifera]|uniref:Uncharacterized protein n=1 Tax=Vitis vinifera TaxID=29760 RepID=A0A438FDZ9_VITVI|nr:hypothetical protein CK203_111664 [Vitis vinifera]
MSMVLVKNCWRGGGLLGWRDLQLCGLERTRSFLGVGGHQRAMGRSMV